MPAYYIDSGQLHTKIIADTPHEACVKALRKELSKSNNQRSLISTLGLITTVSEQGSNIQGNTLIFVTSRILEEIGLTQHEDYVELWDEIFGENEDWWK